MFQARIFFENGSIFRTTPDALFKVQAFARTFEDRDDVVDIHFVDMEKEAAQAQFRSDADEWRQVAERTRKAPTFDSKKDATAVRHYHALTAVGTSG